MNEQPIRGRPKILFLHGMKLGDEVKVPFKDLERTKVSAYRLNARDVIRFSFFTRQGEKYIKRTK